MRWGLIAGLGMMAASTLMFLIAAPRRGEVVTFLKDRDGLQTVYMMVLIGLLVFGAAITTNGWN
jgi:hypothetical protein